MAEFERRHVADEVRVEGRKISGTVIAYGDVSASHRERFEAGSIQLAEAVHLDYEHDRTRCIAWSPDGGLELTDGEDEMRLVANLPPLPLADRVLQEVSAGTRNGLSVEFRAIKQRTENGIRIIEKAILRGVAIVSAPSYGASRVEARSRARRIWL